MHLGDIALNNLKRRKSKMVFLLFGMVFGIATVITLFSITSAMQKDFNKKFNQLGAKLVVAPNTKKLSLAYGGINVADAGISYDVKELNNASINKIKTIPGKKAISGIAPKLLGAVEIKNTRAIIVGVDFKREFQIKDYWEVKGSKPAGSGEILAGSKAARKFALKAGQNVLINGQSFKVAGILHETGSEEDGLIFMELGRTQKLLGKPDTLSFIEVTAARDAGTSVEQIQSQIQKALPDAKVNSVTAAMESRKELVDRFARFSMGVSLVVLLIGSLIVMTTMMASVSERTREIGIFRAIGFRKSHIIKIIYLETAIVSAVSGLIGFIIGTWGAIIVAPRVVEQAGIQIGWSPLVLIAAILIAIVTGILASTYPALRASKLDPAEALRFI